MKGARRRPGRKRSLTTSTAIALFSLSGAALLLSSGLQFAVGAQAQREVVSSRQILIARDAAATTRSFVDRMLGVLATAARLADPTRGSTLEPAWLPASLLGLEPGFRQTVHLDADGGVLGRASRLTAAAATAFCAHMGPEAVAAIRRDGRYISPVYIDASTGEPLVAVAVEARDAFGRLSGCLGAEVNLKFMWELVGSLTIGESGQAYVVDSGGVLIAASDPARVLRHESIDGTEAARVFAGIADGASVVRTYRSQAGVLVVGTFTHLGTPDWAVVTEVRWTEAYRALVRQALLSVATTLVLALLIALIGYTAARRLTVPLVHLAETAGRITGGEMALRADVEGADEVVALATAFNSMTSQLQQVLEGLERRVAERTALLEATNRELEAFTYSVSHDLRAPLRAVRGFTEAILEDIPDLPAEAMSHLRTIQANAREMGVLIESLLDLSRLSRQPLGVQRIRTADLVREVIDSLREELSSRPSSFAIGSLPDCDGDPTLVRQVWMNLVSNAVKFSRRSAVSRIEIGNEDNGEGTVFFVRDNGVGFDSSRADRLFRAFQRLHADADYEGTGVGLAIAQRIVHRHGGRIWGESKPGAGATFRFTLGATGGEAAAEET